MTLNQSLQLTLLLLAPIPAVTAQQAKPRTLPLPKATVRKPTAEQLATENWRKVVIAPRQKPDGCYKIAYPSTIWQTVPCGTVPAVPHLRPSLRLHPLDDENSTGNWTALSTGSITSATGEFPEIDNVTSVTSSGVQNSYSIQLNTNGFKSPQCAQSTNTGCTAAEQFVYDQGYGLAIQEWLVNYLDATTTQCPQLPQPWSTYGASSCWTNVASMQFPSMTFPALAGVVFTAEAVANGQDTFSVAVGKVVYQFAASDSYLGLAGRWDDVDFNIYGYSNDEVLFNPSSIATVRVTENDGTINPPTCAGQNIGGVETYETSNLTLGPCSPFGPGQPSNGISFTESIPPVISSISPTTGAETGGTLVTLNGSGFSNFMEAAFGSTYIGVQCSSSTLCTAYSPSSTGKAEVGVTLANLTATGQPGTFSAITRQSLFVYEPYPNGYMTPSTGSPLGGTAVTLNGSNFSTTPGATTVNFNFSTGPIAAPQLKCPSVLLCTFTTPPLNPAGSDPAVIPVTLTLNGMTFPMGSFTFKNPPAPPTRITCQVCAQRGQKCGTKNGKIVCIGTVQ